MITGGALFVPSGHPAPTDLALVQFRTVLMLNSAADSCAVSARKQLIPHVIESSPCLFTLGSGVGLTPAGKG